MDDFYRAKFDPVTGDVVAGWDSWAWSREVSMNGCEKTSTRNAHKVSYWYPYKEKKLKGKYA